MVRIIFGVDFCLIERLKSVTDNILIFGLFFRFIVPFHIERIVPVPGIYRYSVQLVKTFFDISML